MDSRKKWLFLCATVFLVLVFGVFFLAKLTLVQEWIRSFIERAAQLGWVGVILYVFAYVVCTAVFIPATPYTLGAGAVFGVLKGFLYVVTAANISAIVSFLLGRSLLRSKVKERLGGDPRFAALDSAVVEQGWKIVALTRLSPVFPFAFLNYAYGASRIRFGAYVGGSFIGMMPALFAYVYTGSVLQEGLAGQLGTSRKILYAIGLAATLAVVWIITRTTRRIVQDRLKVDREPS